MALADYEAWILCGGLGTRLQSAVPNAPKSLALVEERPFLDYPVEWLAASGIRRFVLLAGYRAAAIEKLLPRWQRFGEFDLICEPQPLGTGGAIIHGLAQRPRDSLLVLNGDTMALVDLEKMLAFHFERRARATLAVVEAVRVAEGGAIELNQAQEITSFREKGKLLPNAHCSAGVYFFDAKAFAELTPGDSISLEEELLPRWVGQGLFGFPHPGSFVDIGTPDRYNRAGESVAALYREIKQI